jgi:hypothetical protein
VELLEQAINLASQCGCVVRQDWFGGSRSGSCEFQGRRWIFLDLALSPREQLETVLEALRTLPNLSASQVLPELRTALSLRKAA